MRYILIIIFSVFLPAQFFAQVKAKATVDSTHMLIGDQMGLHLNVLAPNGSKLLPFDLEKLTNDPVEFIGQSDWEVQETTNGQLFRKTLVFTVWDSGYHVVTPVPIVISQNGNLDTTLTNDIPMEVQTIPAPELADIKDIIEEAVTWRDYLYVLIPLAILLFAGLLIFIGLRMRTKQEAIPAPPPPPPLPAHELAIKNLRILRSEKLWQQGDVKAYHSRLTHIVREYLEGRYNIQALEQTTDEILPQMRKNDLPQDLTEKMTALLQTADLVKFAKAEPPADYHERAIKMAEEFVAETKSLPDEIQEDTEPESQTI